MTGFVPFTGDPEVAKAKVSEILRAACGGSFHYLSLKLQHADSIIGIHHMYYDAVVECDGPQAQPVPSQ
jgi:hypothetical protein